MKFNENRKKTFFYFRINKKYKLKNKTIMLILLIHSIIKNIIYKKILTKINIYLFGDK